MFFFFFFFAFNFLSYLCFFMSLSVLSPIWRRSDKNTILFSSPLKLKSKPNQLKHFVRQFFVCWFRLANTHMDFCGSPVMRTAVCFSFNKIRRWLLVALCFGSSWKGRDYSVPYKLHILVWLSHLLPLSVLRIDMTDHCLRSRKLDQDRSKSSQYWQNAKTYWWIQSL